MNTDNLPSTSSANSETTSEASSPTMSNVSRPSGVYAIALTGGPSGGKTTAQAVLSDALENLGFTVYRVPETATILLGCGVKFVTLSESQRKSFQLNLLKTLMQIEETVFELAHIKHRETGAKCIVLCDRGAMDPSAYIDRKGWLEIVDELNLKEVDMRDNRYDIVIHLVTAAEGAEKFYTLANNSIRSETPELARTLDNLVMNAWVGHPYLTVIDNSTDFEKKCRRAVQAVLSRIGMEDHPYGTNIKKRKYLVRSVAKDEEFPVSYRDFNVEHVYIKNIGSESAQIRLRKRFDSLNCCHRNITIRRPATEAVDQTIEERRSLTSREYDALELLADEARHRIVKSRRCFLYKNFSYQLDTYVSAVPGLVLLEAYLPRDNDGLAGDKDALLLPPFVEIVREVTKEAAYSMYNIALKTQTDVVAADTN